MVSFAESEMERLIRSSVGDVTGAYGDDYWREVRSSGRFPSEFWTDLAELGWVGVNIPEEYGGGGLGIKELCVVIDEVASAGCWPAAIEFMTTPSFGAETLLAHGSAAQKERWLPKIAGGESRWALGVTEPDAGLNLTNTSTVARREGDEYVVSGRKIWISNVHEADRITLLARTTAREDAETPYRGLSVFLVDPDAPGLEYTPLETDIEFPHDTFNVYLDDVRVPDTALVGEEGEGLYQLFDTLNCERITGAAAAIGMGYHALETASEHARERAVFDAPIGSHQGIQHPLATAFAELRCADLLTQYAAWRYDAGESADEAANVANLQGPRTAWRACEAAMTTFGGMSASKDLGLSSMWGLVRHMRSTPVSEEMLRNYIAEHVLDLPRSY